LCIFCAIKLIKSKIVLRIPNRLLSYFILLENKILFTVIRLQNKTLYPGFWLNVAYNVKITWDFPTNANNFELVSNSIGTLERLLRSRTTGHTRTCLCVWQQLQSPMTTELPLSLSMPSSLSRA